MTVEHIDEMKRVYVTNFWDDEVAFTADSTELWEEAFSNNGYGVVAHHNGNMVAGYYAEKHPFPFNHDVMRGEEVLWFILPEYKRGRNFLKFLNHIEGVNKLHRLDHYVLNVGSGNYRLVENLKKYGYESEAIMVRKTLWENK